MKVHVRITREPLVAEIRPDSGCGAVVRFDGIVRDQENGAMIGGLHYEAYQPMAEQVMEQLLSELGASHPCERVTVQHRIGFVPVGEAAIRVEIHAKHRQEAFALLPAFLDRLKQDVPIWKRVIP